MNHCSTYYLDSHGELKTKHWRSLNDFPSGTLRQYELAQNPLPISQREHFRSFWLNQVGKCHLSAEKSGNPQTWLDISVFLFRVGKTFIKIKQCFFVSLLVFLTRFSHSGYQISSDISSSIIWLICCWIKSTMTVVSGHCRFM